MRFLLFELASRRNGLQHALLSEQFLEEDSLLLSCSCMDMGEVSRGTFFFKQSPVLRFVGCLAGIHAWLGRASTIGDSRVGQSSALDSFW